MKLLGNLCLLILLAVVSTGESLANEDDVEAGTWIERFQFYGHVSIAYSEATSTGLPGDLPSEAILGLSQDGSLDYRNVALQLRFNASDRHHFVLQLSHQRLADSVLEQVSDAVEVDWIFWDWRIGQETHVRLGRLPTPAGLFNEVRDVGTVLPFFRPAFSFYREGSIFSDSVDGVGLSHRFFAQSEWALETNLYAGEFEVFEQGSGVDDDFLKVDASDAIGAQLWLSTPVDGLRFGIGALRWDVSEESQFNPTEATWESWYASIEADFERWVLRSEYRVVELPFQTSIGASGQAEVVATYWQVGWRPVDRLAFYLQSELTDIQQRSSIYLGGSFETDERDDVGFAVNYAYRPNLVFKAEYHEQKFELAVSSPVFTSEGLRVRFDTLDADNEYLIAGVAISF